MEIEKKYLVSHIPDNLDEFHCRHIEQGYLSTNPVVRVRRDNDEYYLTYKGKGMMVRVEYNLPLTREAYEHLIKKADGNIISKKRYELPDNSGHTIELDIFEGDFKGLVYAEVEFPSLEWAEKFKAPSWFVRDVTGEGAYQNSALSTMDKADIHDFIEKTLR